MPFDIK